ncbi:hypothetical protein AXG93_4683s1000 [Marchantia polymorpha subsp. ruderalis]|uniref:Uncharacterized protein n=1 Tax=Marchantia polymorpha subsp. ruderalis TaxID=1480154 RepID=A0A176VBE0_MARPO|nr:hypothetical protein AXG93_4683s1000 [Marchantia polymorpha subsp. ruderalis]
MADQFSLDLTRGELINVVAPPPLEHRLLTDKSSSREEIVISDEEREQLASSLSAFFLKLKQAHLHVANRYPYSGNMSYTPVLATHSLVDGMTEVQYSAGSFLTMEQVLLRNYELAGSFLNVVREKTQTNTDDSVVPGMQALQNFCVHLRQSGIDPAQMLSSIFSRNQQLTFGVSALGCGMTVQIPYIDRLTRKLVQSLSEAWNEQRSIQNVVVTTARVDGNLVKNYIIHIKSRGVVEHYTHSILIYRHTDSRLLLYDYSCVEDKLVFLAAANEEFTMNELEDISGAEIYHCSRDDDGKFKEGDAAAHPRFRLLQKLAKHLKPIRKQRDGSFLKASSKCRLHHCPGLCARLRRHTSQLGCWKHLISGRPPTTEDAERLLEANVMEVMSSTSCPPNVDENQMYSHVPDPFEKRTALVTVVAHKKSESETLKSSQYGRSSRVRDPGWVRDLHLGNYAPIPGEENRL